MTGISRIPSGSLIFGCRVDLSHFLAWRAGTNRRSVQYGRGPPIKAGQPEPSLHLGTTCEIHHIYKDLNESSSARPGRSQQLEIPPSLNSKQAALFSSPAGFSSDAGFSSNAGFSPGAGISTPAKIIRLFFSKHKDFSIRLFFSKRKDF